ncbi:hypothetical protein RRG08_059186 [Elysia crispata]|uniref:Uncharacterized protein n=1 Tax=Elysia crispata TaxID=231223 RepID=A0AAE0ZEF6_9GAST|nr:hypothetical protein RRG08_059186 [Elysia crispata]
MRLLSGKRHREPTTSSLATLGSASSLKFSPFKYGFRQVLQLFSPFTRRNTNGATPNRGRLVRNDWLGLVCVIDGSSLVQCLSLFCKVQAVPSNDRVINKQSKTSTNIMAAANLIKTDRVKRSESLPHTETDTGNVGARLYLP